MNKSKWILIASLLLVFAAGTSVGILLDRSSQAPPSSPLSLSQELKLTPDQQQEMSKIWSEFRRGGWQNEQRSAVTRERDNALQSLLSDAQRKSYEAIQTNYSARIDALRKQRFEEAVQKSKKILDPQQAMKYQELLKKQKERTGGSGEMFGSRRWHSGPSSQATSSQATSQRGQ